MGVLAKTALCARRYGFETPVRHGVCWRGLAVRSVGVCRSGFGVLRLMAAAAGVVGVRAWALGAVACLLVVGRVASRKAINTLSMSHLPTNLGEKVTCPKNLRLIDQNLAVGCW